MPTSGIGQHRRSNSPTPRGGWLYDHAAYTVVTPDLIDQSGVVFAPANFIQAQFVTPGLIDQSGVVFSPQINQKVTPGLIDQSGVVFAPTQITLKVTPGLIDHSGTTFSPTVAPGNVNVTPGLISQTGTVFSPQINLKASIALIDQSGVTFAPQINMRVFFPLIDQSGVTFAPQVSLRIALGLIDQSGVVFAFTQIKQTVTPPLIDHSGVTFSPTVSIAGAGAQTVSPGLIDQSGTTFSPTINQKANIGLIDQSGVVFAPTQVKQTVGGTVYAYDRFNRADGAIGTSDSGHVWTDFEDSSATWSIVNNQAQNTASSAGNQATTTLDSGLKTASVEAMVTFTGNTDAGLTTALVDNSNYMLAVFNRNGNTHIYSRVAGSFSLLTSPNQGATYFDVPRKMRFDWNHATGVASIYGDGVQLATFTVDSTTRNACQGTRQGIRQYDFNGSDNLRFDDFTIASAPMLPVIEQVGQVFAPQNNQIIAFGPIDQTAVAFAPTINGGTPPTPPAPSDGTIRMRRRRGMGTL